MLCSVWRFLSRTVGFTCKVDGNNKKICVFVRKCSRTKIGNCSACCWNLPFAAEVAFSLFQESSKSNVYKLIAMLNSIVVVV